ncbi:MAG TPA: hypothetical protein VGJ13_09805 [Pseudonocardiaceae bacterium]|jgi:hypothetical protein
MDESTETALLLARFRCVVIVRVVPRPVAGAVTGAALTERIA